MPGSSNASFIPKQGPVKKDRSASRKQVYVGTFIVRILFFAALLAAGGVYAYESKLEGDLNEEIASLNNAIKSFNEAEMQRVISTDLRMRQVAYRLEHSVAVTKILGAIEEATIRTAQISGLSVKRADDTFVEVSAEMEVDSFDSALFQKQVFGETAVLKMDGIKDLTLQREAENDEDGGSSSEVISISFQAVLGVDSNEVSHSVNDIISDAAILETQTEVTATTTEVITPAEEGEDTSVTANNNEII